MSSYTAWKPKKQNEVLHRVM